MGVLRKNLTPQPPSLRGKGEQEWCRFFPCRQVGDPHGRIAFRRRHRPGHHQLRLWPTWTPAAASEVRGRRRCRFRRSSHRASSRTGRCCRRSSTCRGRASSRPGASSCRGTPTAISRRRVRPQASARQVPTRLVSSAKSWLCHPGVDRKAADPAVEGARRTPRKVSPLEATTRYLKHLVEAWNHAIAKDVADHRLEQQDIILTVPASFDAVARELTVEAARAGGPRAPHAARRTAGRVLRLARRRRRRLARAGRGRRRRAGRATSAAAPPTSR